MRNTTNNLDVAAMAKQIQDNMNKLLIINDKFIAGLPIEHREKVAPIQSDIHSVLDAAKKGDISKINEISLRYADNNRK